MARRIILKEGNNLTGTMPNGVRAIGYNGTQLSEHYGATVSDIGGLPYKVYSALLSQSGTDAPTASVLENTLGFTVGFSYNMVGDYDMVASVAGGFKDIGDQKTMVFMGPLNESNGYGLGIFTYELTNGDFIVIRTRGLDMSGNVTSQNEMLYKTPIEIRIYP